MFRRIYLRGEKPASAITKPQLSRLLPAPEFTGIEAHRLTWCVMVKGERVPDYLTDVYPDPKYLGSDAKTS